MKKNIDIRYKNINLNLKGNFEEEYRYERCRSLLLIEGVENE